MARYIDTELLEKEAKCLYSINNFEPVKAYTQEQIDNAPTADVKEVVRGKWVLKNEGTYNRLRAYCSECGLHSGIGGIRKNQIKPFCPNCGADMREVE